MPSIPQSPRPEMVPASFSSDAGQYPSPVPAEKLPSKPIKRISRACLRCRQRKSKCNLGTLGQPGIPPCQTCVRDQVECILATSKRGGKRVRKSTITAASSKGQAILGPSEHFTEGSFTAVQTYPQNSSPDGELNTITASNIDDTIASTDLHATSEALNMLSQAAQLETYATPGQRSHVSERTPAGVSPGIHLISSTPVGSSSFEHGVLQYALVSQGLLTTAQVSQLVARFKKYYHPYLPVAPRRSFDPDSLQYLATQEPHLLTAIITVAARDLPQSDGTLHTCSSYMHQLVSEIMAGKKCDVEAVEALLLLAEWEPQDSLSEGKEVGCGEEDRAAWMHVGLALRIGYFLGLDRTAIKHDDEDKAAHFNRRRVTWAACYNSDRQLSARIGRAFWSRGPVALAGVGRHGRQTFDDFKPLQPQTPDETDYASILQANLDLTQLFSNVHDVLYSGMGSSMKLMLAGNYVKYVDDFRRAIEGWKSIWGTLTCPPTLKSTLQMTYDYLRLYTNAYAFQATVTRAVAAAAKGAVRTNESPHNGVPSLPDARFIYESVDAAKSLLSTICSYIDAENCLRFLPLRFSLYCVNSAVFLYKAWSFNVLTTPEKLGIRHMITDVIHHLNKASVRPNDFSSRYSLLLDRLWQRKDSEVRQQSTSQGKVQTGGGSGNESRGSSNPNPNSNAIPNNTTPGTTSINPITAPTPTANPGDGGGGGPYAATSLRNTPWYSGQQDEFSWLDLQAVGELVSGAGADPDNMGSGTYTYGGGGYGGMDGFGFGAFGNFASGSGAGGGEWNDGDFGSFGGVGMEDGGRFF